VILATLATGNFEFKALGNGTSEAKALVVAGFERHLRQYDSSPEQWASEVDHGRYVGQPFAASLEDWYGINTCEIAVGVCLRDYEVV
jgi:hypothetical protein